MPRKILLVDDDELLRRTLAAVLEEEGFEIVEAQNGREAVACLRSGERPWLILLDMDMPVMTGQAFLELRKHDPALAAIAPVIAMSAGVERAPEGALAFLAKPFSTD